MNEEILNEEMSNTKYMKKVNALKKAFMSQFSKDAFIAFNDDFSGKSGLLDAASKAANFDKQALKSIYSRYNKYKKNFENATSEKSSVTNNPKHLEDAKTAIADLRKLGTDVVKAVGALKKGKMAIKKGADKSFDIKVKDKARQAKWFADQKANKGKNARKSDKMDLKYADKKRRKEFIGKVKSKVAKINFKQM